VLIGNTGGDRLIDWVGEFNSYLVPFAPFGMATVSRTLQPQLAEFLYALSASDGADPTRAADTGSPPGSATASPRASWASSARRTSPGRPDRRPGRPAGRQHPRRQARRAALGQLQRRHDAGRGADSGTWQVSGGTLQVAATSNKADAVAVYQVGDALPSYYEVLATIKRRQADGGLERQQLRDLRLPEPDQLQVRRPERLDQQAGDGHSARRPAGRCCSRPASRAASRATPGTT
jgi:hypothetical protein